MRPGFIPFSPSPWSPLILVIIAGLICSIIIDQLREYPWCLAQAKKWLIRIPTTCGKASPKEPDLESGDVFPKEIDLEFEYPEEILKIEKSSHSPNCLNSALSRKKHVDIRNIDRHTTTHLSTKSGVPPHASPTQGLETETQVGQQPAQLPLFKTTTNHSLGFQPLVPIEAALFSP
jgi:hypothetical protein